MEVFSKRWLEIVFANRIAAKSYSGLTRVPVRTALGFYLILFCLSGCSLLSSKPELSPEQKNSSNQAPIEDARTDGSKLQQSEAPLSLSIIDEVNDGEILHVLASVTAQTDWQRKDVILRLSGLQDGEIVHRSDYRLDALAVDGGTDLSQSGAAHEKEIIPAGQKYNLSLAIPSTGISDYQLELLWGSEAKASYQSKSAGQLRIQHLEVEGKREQCEPGPCQIAYTFSGELFNAGETEIREVDLGVGFVWESSEQNNQNSARLPESETPVHIADLGLKPGESKPLRLALDQTVPESSKGSFKPVLRILSFNGKNAQ